MARPLRIDIENGWYHITARGIDRRKIFDGGRDNGHFLELLEECVSRHKIRLHAYCLMTNHYHLLLQTPCANASKAIQWLNVSYGVWYNRKHQRVGPLFQGRFGSKPVDADGAWALDLSVYMHLNPVRVGMLGLVKKEGKAEARGWRKPTKEEIEARLAVLRGHRWSSYAAYAGFAGVPAWLTSQTLWDRCQAGRYSAKDSYRRLVENRVRCGEKEDDIAGLKTALAVGSIEFVERIKKLVKGDPKEQPDVRQWLRMTPFEKVIGALERVRGESWEELRDRRGDDAKGVALLLGRRHCGMSLRELGEAAGGMEYHAVSKALTRVEQKAEKAKSLRALIDKMEKEIV